MNEPFDEKKKQFAGKGNLFSKQTYIKLQRKRKKENIRLKKII